MSDVDGAELNDHDEGNDSDEATEKRGDTCKLILWATYSERQNEHILTSYPKTAI